jgi:hypothetical protein
MTITAHPEATVLSAHQAAAQQGREAGRVFQHREMPDARHELGIETGKHKRAFRQVQRAGENGGGRAAQV